MSPTRTTRLGLVTLLTVAMSLTACAPDTAGDPNPSAPHATGGPAGQWGEIAEESAYLTINDDGTVLGHDGCNGLGGNWHVADDVIHFDDMVTTLIMCEGRDTWLGLLKTAVVDGDTLHVLDEGGEVVGTLPRVS